MNTPGSRFGPNRPGFDPTKALTQALALSLMLAVSTEAQGPRIAPSRSAAAARTSPSSTAGIHRPGANETGRQVAQLLGTPKFIANNGQYDPRVKFKLTIDGQTLWFTSESVVMDLSASSAPERRSVVTQRFVHGRAAQVDGVVATNTVFNFVRSTDQIRGVKSYTEILYRDLWPGIDVRYFVRNGRLEHEFRGKPGADMSLVRVAYEGIDALAIESDGRLRIETPLGTLNETAPKIFEEEGSRSIHLDGEFVLAGAREYTFSIPGRDARRPIVIDPVLVFGTYLGGSGNESSFGSFGSKVAVDDAGAAYVTGNTSSADFPLVDPVVDVTSGLPTGYIAKMSASGTDAFYVTFLTLAKNIPTSLAYDRAGYVYVTGFLQSSTGVEFPVLNGYGTPDDQGVFLAKFEASTGTMIYSSRFGVSGITPHALAVGTNGDVCIAGSIRDFAVGGLPLVNQFASFAGGSADAFVLKLDTTTPGADSLTYSTLLGGSDFDHAYNVAMDFSGDCVVVGMTGSSNFPTRNAYRSTFTPTGTRQIIGNVLAGHSFVAKLRPTAAGDPSLLFSTFLGGTDVDAATAVAIGKDGAIFAGGVTYSDDFPTTPGAFQRSHSYGVRSFKNTDGFVVKLASTGATAIFATYLGSIADSQTLDGLGVGPKGDVFATGTLIQGDGGSAFPTTPDALYPSPGGMWDSYVARLNATGSALTFSTLLYSWVDWLSLAVDSANSVYVTGRAPSAIPVTPGAFQTVSGGGHDSFLLRIAADALPFQFSAIRPTRGGDNGQVTLTLIGSGFQTGAVPTLVCPSGSIPSTGATHLSPHAVSLNAAFDLHGAPHGTCDVSVRNPDGTTRVLDDAFTIEAGTGERVWVDLAGRSTIRVSRRQTYLLTYGNRGNVDALGVMIHVAGAPAGSIVTVETGLVNPVSTPGTPPVDFSEFPLAQTVDSEEVLSLFIPALAAGSTRVVGIGVTLPVDVWAAEFELKAWANEPLFHSPMSLEDLDCFVAVCTLGFEVAMTRVLPDGCLGELAKLINGSFAEQVRALGTNDTPMSLMKLLADAASAVVACARVAGIFIPHATAVEFVLTLYDLISRWHQIEEITNKCKNTLAKLDAPLAPVVLLVRILIARDPNDKIGPAGVGSSHFVSPDRDLPYIVHFENMPTATGAAQEIRVSDQLDLSVLDPDSIRLSSILFGKHVVSVPDGLQAFSTDVDLRPDVNLVARVTVSFDKPTGVVSWRLQSLDPATMEPTTDPDLGLLPPNVTPPEGDGAVVFLARVRPGVGTGTEVSNRASIVFDTNAPIVTNRWVNTIDDTAPTSRVNALPPTTTTASFSITWLASDAGAGPGRTSVYVSDNGGPFALLIDRTTDAAAMFAGEDGHTYAFFSVTEDLVGNVEAAKSAGEASTTVTLSRPNLQISALAGASVAGAGLPYVVTDTTINRGSSAAGASTTAFFLSSNSTWEAGDTPLLPPGGRPVPPLAVGGLSKTKTTATIPPGTTVGKYFLIAVADAGEQVAESEEIDNARSKIVYVGPDLTISKVAGPTDANRGQTISVTLTTKNAGGAPTTPTTTRVYLSLDKKVGATDVPLGDDAVGSMNAKSQAATTVNMVIPPATLPRAYYLLIRADDTNALAESRETNNLKAIQILVH